MEGGGRENTKRNLPTGSDKLSCCTDLVLLAEGEQASLVLGYQPVLQCPLCLGEALHERVDEAIELHGLVTAPEDKGFGIRSRGYQHVLMGHL